MSNVNSRIKRAKKKEKRKEEAELAGRMLAIKQLITRQAFSTMKVIVTFMFPQLRSECGIDYTTASWLVDELVKYVAEDEDLFNALSETISSNGTEDGGKVSISPEKLATFIELSKEKVTLEKCKEILSRYDKAQVALETALGASKIMNERSGQEFEIVSNGTVDLPEELKGE